jgi:hypothetical protein
VRKYGYVLDCFMMKLEGNISELFYNFREHSDGQAVKR